MTVVQEAESNLVLLEKLYCLLWGQILGWGELWDSQDGEGRTVNAACLSLLCLCVIPSVRAMTRIAQLEERHGAFGGICVTPAVLFSCQTLVPVSWVSETCSTGAVPFSWVMLLKGQGMALAAAVSRTGAAWGEGTAVGQGRLFLRYWLEGMEANCHSNKFHCCPSLVFLLVWVMSIALPGSHKAFLEQPVQRAFVCTENCCWCWWSFGSVLPWWAVMTGVPARLVVVW